MITTNTHTNTNTVYLTQSSTSFLRDPAGLQEHEEVMIITLNPIILDSTYYSIILLTILMTVMMILMTMIMNYTRTKRIRRRSYALRIKFNTTRKIKPEI